MRYIYIHIHSHTHTLQLKSLDHNAVARVLVPIPTHNRSVALPAFGTYLLRVAAEYAVQNQERKEQRPLALNVVKDLQLGGLVVQARLVLQRSHVAVPEESLAPISPCTCVYLWSSLSGLRIHMLWERIH